MISQRPAAKALLSAFLLVAVLLVGSPVMAAWEYLSGDAPKDKANVPADSLCGNDTKGNGEASKTAGSVKQDIADRRLQPTVEHSNLTKTVEKEDLFSEKTILSSSIGIPLVFNDAVDRYIHYFSVTKKDLFNRWLKRKKLYEPLIREILQEHGLPEDLVYLAMIESGFNLQAYSPMKAAGPWQFIPETGKRYGLTVDYWIDERRDIEKSTIAAARYLDKLFNQFDCWYLAAAAYNTGENRIDRLIRRHDTKDFWQLRAYNTLPRETREYVPQLIAAAIIAKNPEKYGLFDNESVTPLEFVGEDVPGGVPLTAVAEAASTDLPSVVTLNPELRRGITPPGKECRIKLPAGTDSDSFQNSLASILEKGKRVVGVVRHMIKGRDNVSKITQRYGVSKDDLILVNGSRLKWRKGELVYIPQFDGADGEEEPTLAKTADFKRALVEEIDTNEDNSRKSTIKRFKGLKTAHIKQGKRLRVASHVKKTTRNSAKKYRPAERRNVLQSR
jgi:membrane-bound lytic murein transglycosylase D